MDFRRRAHIEATMDIGDIERSMKRIQRLEDELYDKRKYRLRQLQKRAGNSADKRRQLSIQNTQLELDNEKKKVRGAEKALAEIEQAERRFEAKHKARLRRAERENEQRHRARRQLELHTQRTREREEREAEAAIKASMRRVEEADRRMNAARVRHARASSTGRRHAGSGVGAFGGLGKGGGFGMLYGSGGVGVALAGGFLAEAAVRSAGGAALERDRSVSKMMSLVADAERSAGFDFAYAKEQAKALAVEMGISVPEAAQAMREAITAAVSPWNSDEYVRMARMLSIIEGVDLEKTVTSLTAIRNAFGLSGDQMLAVPDVLFAGVDEGNLKLGKLASQIGNASAMANQAGIDLRELAAAASALTKAGMTSDTAFTSLRAFSTLVQKPATKRVEANRRVAAGMVPGFDVTPEAIKSQGLIKWLDQLNLALDRTGMRITDLIGGRERALRGVSLLLGNMNESFKNIYAQQAENPGIGMERGMEVMEGSMGRWERIVAQFESGWADLGDMVVSAFETWAGEGWDFEETLLQIQRGFSFTIQLVSLLTSGMMRFAQHAENVAAILTFGIVGDFDGSAYNLFNEKYEIAAGGRANQRMDELNNQLRALEAARAAGLNPAEMEYSESQNAYIPKHVVKPDVQSLGTTAEARAAAGEEHMTRQAIASIKDWNAAIEEHKKVFTKAESEKTSALTSALNAQKSIVLQHYKELKAVMQEAAQFNLAMQDKVSQRREEFSGTTQLQKFMLLQQRMKDAQDRAAAASRAGDFDTAKMYNTRAIEAADEMRNYDVRALSKSKYRDRETTIENLAGITDQMSPLEQMRRRAAARRQVEGTIASLGDYVDTYDLDSNLRKDNVSKQYSLSAMEMQIEQGQDIRAVQKSKLEMDAEKAGVVYDDLARRLATARDLWTEITDRMTEAAEMFATAAEDAFQGANVHQLQQDLQGAAGFIERKGMALDSIAVPNADQDEVAKARGDVYHQETIDVKITVDGAGDPAAVAEAVAERLRQGLDRGAISLTPTK